MPLAPGTEFGAHRILDLIGAGGMGEVYRAHDTNLKRDVAIKVLSGDVADAAARRRFQREAQTASSLNHPHILTVHDAGEADGRQYLVMELVEGGTLRQWAQQPRDWRDTVELLTGVADGLAVAHEAGILHRDIKPENILIGKARYAKLADFGLAKLEEAAAAEDQTRTVTFAGTRDGVILGTAAYMSPEQASGRRLDARSDVFSFGVVFYEMLAARRPFSGATIPDVLHAILHQAAAPLPADVPDRLRLIVEKALEKNPSDRYQSMRDMVVDLRRLLRQGSDGSPARDSFRWTPARIWGATAAIAALLLAAVALFLFNRVPPAPVRRDYVQLTNFADSVTSPVLSPDGRMLAFLRSQSEFSGRPGEVYVKPLPDGEPVRLTDDGRSKSNPKFSPGGDRIAYTTPDATGATLETWTVPVLGGRPQLLLSNSSGLTWIRKPGERAAGPSLLFSEFTGRGYQMSIVSSSENRTGLRTVYLPSETGMAHRSYLSPDGKHILLAEMTTGWLPCRLVPFDGSDAGKSVGPTPGQCTDAAWSPDGKWMYFATDTGNGRHIWRQRFPDGAPEQVTFGVTEEEGIAFAPDGRSFVTAIGSRQSTLWIHDGRGDRQITSEGFAFSPTISPDGKQLFYLVRSGGVMNFMTGALWVSDLDSGDRRRVLTDFAIAQYNLSSDGKRVVFVASAEPEGTAVWLATVDGRIPPRRLTPLGALAAYFGAPGEVVIASMEKMRSFIYRVKEDGTDLRRISPSPMFFPFSVSPDGRWVPVAEGPSPDMRNALMVHPADGGPPLLVCRCYPPPDIDNGPMPPQMSWSPDGRFLYVKYEQSLYAIPLKAGQMLPPIPPAGFQSKEALAALPGARLVSDQPVFPGPDPSVYAYMKVSANRNIYRVPVQ